MSRVDLGTGALVSVETMNKLAAQTYRIVHNLSGEASIPSPHEGMLCSIPSLGRVDIFHNGRWKMLWFAKEADRNRIQSTSGALPGAQSVFTSSQVVTHTRMNALNAATVHIYADEDEQTLTMLASSLPVGTLVVTRRRVNVGSRTDYHGIAVFQICDVSSGSRLIVVSAPTQIHALSSTLVGRGFWRESGGDTDTVSSDNYRLLTMPDNSTVEQWEGIWGYGNKSRTITHSLGELRYALDMDDGSVILYPRPSTSDRNWRTITRRTISSNFGSRPIGWTDIAPPALPNPIIPNSSVYGNGTSIAWNPWYPCLGVLRSWVEGPSTQYSHRGGIVLSLYAPNGSLLGHIDGPITGNAEFPLIVGNTKDQCCSSWLDESRLIWSPRNGRLDISVDIDNLEATFTRLDNITAGQGPRLKNRRGQGYRSMMGNTGFAPYGYAPELAGNPLVV